MATFKVLDYSTSSWFCRTVMSFLQTQYVNTQPQIRTNIKDSVIVVLRLSANLNLTVQSFYTFDVWSGPS